jgi:adenylate cyclase
MNPAWAIAAAAAVGVAALALLLRRRSGEVALLRARLDRRSDELERLQQAFGRFAPEEIVERVIASGLQTTGERKDATVLFADLVGYTPLSESVDPAVLVRILNGYFQRMSRAITENRGHVSTLIGDGILALFGALEPNPWQVNDAAHTALAMREELAAYNRELEGEGLAPLGIGVGLHHGTGVAGLVGSRELTQFAFVGRTINVASRVQDLTRVHGVDILVTDEVRERLDPRFVLRSLPPAEVRGVAEPVGIHAVIGFGEPEGASGVESSEEGGP